MNRIDRRYDELRELGRCGVIPFITAGHPHPDWTVDIMHALVEAGADFIELGVPFSDPMADGPVIQSSSEKAIAAGMSLSRVIVQVSEFRERDAQTPVILMGYLNPIVRAGLTAFSQSAAAAGVDAVLLVDCPPEECNLIRGDLRSVNLHQIFLVAPTTSDERLDRLGKVAGGFVYYVALKGVTGAGHLDIDAVSAELERVRRHVDQPLAVGFGIKTPDQAASLAPHAAAVVVGSALVASLDACGDRRAVADAARGFLTPLAKAVAQAGVASQRVSA